MLVAITILGLWLMIASIKINTYNNKIKGDK